MAKIKRETFGVLNLSKELGLTPQEHINIFMGSINAAQEKVYAIEAQVSELSLNANSAVGLTRKSIFNKIAELEGMVNDYNQKINSWRHSISIIERDLNNQKLF